MKDTPSTPFDDFDAYMRQEEPQKRERAESWKTAIGLQAVDGLSPSGYLVETAKRHIEGDISIDEVKELIESYYQGKADRLQQENGTEEADKVSANITRILNEKTFTFSPAGFLSIHRRVFGGVFPFAGKIRDYNISKKEWVLQGDTVLYTGAEEIPATLEYDFNQEKEFDYTGLTLDEMIKHFTKFIAGLWQIHPFAEGNTRTTAVFTIKYLRYMGFDVHNDIFAENAWYFRNALVRANYRNYRQGIAPDNVHLERFFRNVLLGENNELKNRNLSVHIQKQENTAQAPHKHRTSTAQVQTEADEPRLLRLIQTVGEAVMSVTEMLQALNLSHRGSFAKLWLAPALEKGLMRLLYPDTPKHPQQKYLLTEKGLSIYQQLKKHGNSIHSGKRI